MGCFDAKQMCRARDLIGKETATHTTWKNMLSAQCLGYAQLRLNNACASERRPILARESVCAPAPPPSPTLPIPYKATQRALSSLLCNCLQQPQPRRQHNLLLRLLAWMPCTMDCYQEEPFRFLDLPKELRLMVYDFIPVQGREFKIRKDLGTGEIVLDDPNPAITATSYHTSTQILRVCREIHDEAYAIMKRKLDQIKTTTPQTTLYIDAPYSRSLLNDFISMVTHWAQALRENGSRDFRHWLKRRRNGHNSSCSLTFPAPMLRFIRQAGIQLQQQNQQLYTGDCLENQGIGEFTNVVFALQVPFHKKDLKSLESSDDHWKALVLRNVNTQLATMDSYLRLPNAWMTFRKDHRLSSKPKTPPGGWSSDHLMIWCFSVTAEEVDSVVKLPGKRDLWSFGSLAED
jgi:hypothetical protein